MPELMTGKLLRHRYKLWKICGAISLEGCDQLQSQFDGKFERNVCALLICCEVIVNRGLRALT